MPFDPASLAPVMQPVSAARGLPNTFYIDEDTFALEREHVFFANWAGLGFASDVANKGDVKPISFLGMPMLLARDRKGVVRVFHNICRHRGMILVKEPQNFKTAVTCAYHMWCYGLDGKLRTTPNVGGPGVDEHADIDKGALGLHEVRSHIWKDVVFVNVSGTAPAFDDYTGDLLSRWSEFEKPMVFGGQDSILEYDLKTNWKLAIENYCESYHLPSIHPGLNSYSKLEDHYNIQGPGPFAGQGTRVYSAQVDDSGREFDRFDGLSDTWDAGAEYIALFPNVLLGVHKDHVFAFIIEPQGLHRTTERCNVYYTGEAMLDHDYDAMRQNNRKLWNSVFLEDVEVVEGMQAGRACRAFDGGKFSPVMDEPTHHFHRWVAEQIAAGTGLARAAAE